MTAGKQENQINEKMAQILAEAALLVWAGSDLKDLRPYFTKDEYEMILAHSRIVFNMAIRAEQILVDETRVVPSLVKRGVEVVMRDGKVYDGTVIVLRDHVVTLRTETYGEVTLALGGIERIRIYEAEDTDA